MIDHVDLELAAKDPLNSLINQLFELAYHRRLVDAEGKAIQK